MADLLQPGDVEKLGEVVRLMQDAKRWDLADAVSRTIPAPDACRKCGAKRGERCAGNWTTCEGSAVHLERNAGVRGATHEVGDEK